MGEKMQRLSEAMAAVTQGDLERFGELLVADDVVWHWSGQSSVSGDYHGREEALGLIRHFRELTANQLVVEPLDVLEGDEYLMSFTHVTASKEDGTALDVIMADAMRFGPDGRVVEFWTLSNDQKGVDEFIG
jgi:ketosteroid isomerase-like protein